MSWEKVANDVGSGPSGLFKWLIILGLVFAVIFGVLRFVGMASERAVFKASHQYQEGQQSAAAILRANIVEIDEQLLDDPGNPSLLSQKRILSARLSAIEVNN